jgi:Asp-tRNA(Asn)/Glu-tRNA(Gln) amidotransferase A subunit family amidase
MDLGETEQPIPTPPAKKKSGPKPKENGYMTSDPKAYHQKWRDEHKDRLKTYYDKRNQSEAGKEYKRQYAMANHEKIKEYRREYFREYRKRKHMQKIAEQFPVRTIVITPEYAEQLLI